jgi:hypothetical protein
METTDVLVLGGGRTLGEAWMSAPLAGLEQHEGFDARGCRCYVGTSAGSIAAASLAAEASAGARELCLNPPDRCARRRCPLRERSGQSHGDWRERRRSRCAGAERA